jgi:REP element-mobilizing transposase RayT
VRRAAHVNRHPSLVTWRVKRGIPSLRSARLVREIESSFRASSERGRFRVVHYSIQRDHVHLIVEATDASSLACGAKSIGSRLARAVNRVFRRTGAVLADRYHAVALRAPRAVRNAIAYVLLNGRRHLAKLGREVDPRGRIDPASSGRWFAGWRSREDPAADAPATATPRTWLLGAGWRRAGLIDAKEIPGRR